METLQTKDNLFLTRQGILSSSIQSTDHHGVEIWDVSFGQHSSSRHAADFREPFPQSPHLLAVNSVSVKYQKDLQVNVKTLMK